MPLFEFKCPECGRVEERLKKSAEDADRFVVSCPMCEHPMQRQISAAAFTVNGKYTGRTGYADEQVVRKNHGNGIKTEVRGHFEQHDNIMQRKERIQSK